MRSRTLELIAMLLAGLVLLLYGIKGAPGAETSFAENVDVDDTKIDGGGTPGKVMRSSVCARELSIPS